MVTKKRGLFARAFVFLSDEVTEALHFLVADGGGAFLFIIFFVPREGNEVGRGVDAVLGKVGVWHKADIGLPAYHVAEDALPPSVATDDENDFPLFQFIECLSSVVAYLAHEELVDFVGGQAFFSSSSSFFSSFSFITSGMFIQSFISA